MVTGCIHNAVDSTPVSPTQIGEVVSVLVFVCAWLDNKWFFIFRYILSGGRRVR